MESAMSLEMPHHAVVDMNNSEIHVQDKTDSKNAITSRHLFTTEKDPEQIANARTRKYVPWCDDYERMISGMLYDPWVKPLNIARYKARAWRHHYNSFFEIVDVESESFADYTERRALVSNILGRVGSDAWIEPPFNFDYGCNIAVGDSFYSNFNLVIIDGGLVTFGDRVMVGPNVSIYTVGHETEVRSRRDNIEFARPVTIGDDCWIGGNVTILPGCTIGRGCTIGAGSIVTRDIPDWSVAFGSPAKVVRKVKSIENIKERSNDTLTDRATAKN